MSIDWRVSDRANPWREVRGILKEFAAIELGLLPDAGNLKVTQNVRRRIAVPRQGGTRRRTLSAHRCHADIRTQGPNGR